MNRKRLVVGILLAIFVVAPGIHHHSFLSSTESGPVSNQQNPCAVCVHAKSVVVPDVATLHQSLETATLSSEPRIIAVGADPIEAQPSRAPPTHS